MENIIRDLIKILDSDKISTCDVIPWASPVVSFGSLQKAEIATVGINPSNLEFVNKNGFELDGLENRRFHTLRSLQVNDWASIDSSHCTEILSKCDSYFENNPYDKWFKRLEAILPTDRFSYYEEKSNVCHIDLVPFATSKKWGNLTSFQKEQLLDISSESFALIIKNSSIDSLILNGQSVVNYFEKVVGCPLHKDPTPGLDLFRKNGKNVLGFAYKGVISQIGSINLQRNIRVYGFNHNIQSSFGVTNAVLDNLREWLKGVF